MALPEENNNEQRVWSLSYCDQLQSPLFRLPAELREVILSYALIASGQISDPRSYLANDICSRDRFAGVSYTHVPRLGTSVLRSCQRLHNETPIIALYEHNTFRFSHPYRVHAFLQSLTIWQRSSVRHLDCQIRVNHERFCPAKILSKWVSFFSRPRSDTGTITDTSTNNGSSCLQEGVRLYSLRNLVLETLTFDLVGVDVEMARIKRVGGGGCPANFLGRHHYVMFLRMIADLWAKDSSNAFTSRLQQIRICSMYPLGRELEVAIHSSMANLQAWHDEAVAAMKSTSKPPWHEFLRTCKEDPHIAAEERELGNVARMILQDTKRHFNTLPIG